MKSLIASSVSGMIGVATGGIIVALLATRPEPAPPAPAGPVVQVTSSPLEGTVERSLRELSRLQARVSSLEEAPVDVERAEPTAAREDDDAARPAGSALPAPRMRTHEESRERALKMRDEQLAHFAEETADPEWAGATAKDFQADLGALAAELKSSSATVECRTSLCKGTLKWPSYSEASGSLMPLLMARYKTNCATTVALPEPDDRSAPYEGNVFFDCTQARTN